MESLNDFFKVSLFMSGTPADYQEKISQNSDFTSDCSLCEAIEKKYICRPTLNIAKCEDIHLPYLLEAVYNREKTMKNADIFGVRILSNMKSIDDCQKCAQKILKMKEKGHFDKNLHIIVIHSEKKTTDGIIYRSFIDNVDISEKTQYSFFEKYVPEGETCENFVDFLKLIDEGKVFKGDPIIMFQVDMISEGVNIKSFNSVIIQSQSEKKEMQQIGRVLRDIKIGNYSKKEDGWASIYAISENEKTICELLSNLSDYGLKLEDMDWGDRIDISTSGGDEDDEEEEFSKKGGLNWNKLADFEIHTYMIAWGGENRHRVIRTLTDKDFANIDFASLEAIVENMNFSTKELNRVTKELKEKHEKTRKTIKDSTNEEHKKKLTQKEKRNIQKTIQKVFTMVNSRLNSNDDNKYVHSKARLIFLNDVFNGNDAAVKAWCDLTAKYEELRERAE